MSLVLSLDKHTQDRLVHLATYKNTFHLDQPKKLSSNLTHSKPVVGMVANFIYSKEPYDPVKEANMKELLEN